MRGLLSDCFSRAKVSNEYSKEILEVKLAWLTEQMHGKHNFITLFDCLHQVEFEHISSEINNVRIGVSIANVCVPVGWRHVGKVGSNIDQPAHYPRQIFCFKQS